MATKLTYPKMPHVKLGLWQLKNKIKWAVGYRPTIWSGNDDLLHLDFEADLTQQQIDSVDAILNSPDPQGPDVNLMVVNNSYVLCDIWEYRAIISAQCGFDFRVYYRHSGTVPGNYYPDEIVCVPTGPGGSQRILTNQNKKAFTDALAALNRWE